MSNNLDTNASLRNYSKQEMLEDGRSVLVRAVCSEDKQALKDGFSRLTIGSKISRFFYNKSSLSDDELKYYTEVDFDKHVAIGVVLLEEDLMLPIGIGRYVVDVDQPNRAEIALTVDEMYRGIGVATLMLKHLCAIARGAGIQEFRGVVLAGNNKMQSVIKRSGFPFKSVFTDGEFQVTIDITKG
ncbi:GNAT family N-acetyltransferase [Thermodesulfobacteriota bacterium]